MARDDGGAAGTIITAFVLGALTGAAVALLVAPATGEETTLRDKPAHSQISLPVSNS